MRGRRALRRGRAAAGLLGALLAVTSPAAAAPDQFTFTVASHRFAVPFAFLQDPWLFASGENLHTIMDLNVRWPDFAPDGTEHDYRTGLMVVAVQDVSASSRVRDVYRVPGTDHARFLQLWRNSSVDQTALSDDFQLTNLRKADREGDAPGLWEMVGFHAAPTHPQVHFYADADRPAAGPLMFCDFESSCQLWWQRDDAAVEVTFDHTILPRWREVRDGVAALLDRLQRS